MRISDWSSDVCSSDLDEGRKAIFRQIVTESFVETFGLMTQIAIIAEKLDHHPDWSKVYNRLDMWLTTHDAGGVSQRATIFAHEIDRLPRSTSGSAARPHSARHVGAGIAVSDERTELGAHCYGWRSAVAGVA